MKEEAPTAARSSNTKRARLRRAAAGAAAGWMVWAGGLGLAPAMAAPPDKEPAVDPVQAVAQARQVATALAAELSARCPVAEPGSTAAFDACRQALFGPSSMRSALAPNVLWGRQRVTTARLADTSLTQFAPDVLTGMYLPLFMFSGEHKVEWVPSEKLARISLRTAFRNRLQPGQFPYPFWHEAEKWSMYQAANEVLLWWSPRRAQVVAAQFTVHGEQAPLARSEPVPAHAFDGKWMWADAQGKAQPKVTLFDGLFQAENPYAASLDGAYRKLALRLREGQCDSCHVPDNPHKTKRLVLLQTPAHAAAEIRRVLKSLQTDRMPIDETGIETSLAPKVKQALLDEGEAFAKLVDAAKAWEAGRLAGGSTAPAEDGSRGAGRAAAAR
jgi:hypothetical protein